MGRIAAIALLVIAGTIGIFHLMDEWPGAEAPIFLAGLAVAAVVSLLAYFVSHRTVGRINPFEVYLWLLVALVLCVILGSVLQMLGPTFLVILTISLVPAGAFAWWRQSQKAQSDQRAEMGLCSTCGYDLRATDALCPECGSPLPAEIERIRRIREELSKAREQPPPQKT
jgi:uncharacterized membrane protein YfcA